MARIRSIHPGLWTDERFAGVSAHARLLFMGIWNECDDCGSFEWSPIKLKMRILPADNVDAEGLLAELAGAGMVMGYELGGRQYGAVRNFCQFQRPKKPNSTYPQTDEVRDYVGTEARSTRDGSEGVRKELPTGGEKARQMEDGGGRRVVPLPSGNGGVDPEKVMFDSGIKLLGAAGKSEGQARTLLGKWKRDQGAAAVIEALGAAQRVGAVDPAAFIEGRFRAKRKSQAYDPERITV